MSRRILVLAAHPDDEVLGCGGLIARTLRTGGEVHVVILTDGCITQYPDSPDLIQRKQEEARRALDKLGGGGIEFLGLPDMALSTLPPAAVNGPVAEAVARHHPDWVVVHHRGDLNRDHRLTHEAARVACRPTAERAPRVLSYETLSSTEWGTEPFVPNVYVRLELEDLKRKMCALEAYQTEVRPWPHPRSPAALSHLAHLRGAQAGVDRAEAYQLIWERS